MVDAAAMVPAGCQHETALKLLQADPLVCAAAEAMRRCQLPQAHLVSGLLFQSIWNKLTDRRPGYGIRDIDLLYFDTSDLSYEAEDRAIRAAAPLFAALQAPVEIRNQARVHLWFEQRFGRTCPPIRSIADSLSRFVARTQAMALSVSPDGAWSLKHPFGLEDVLALRYTPNPQWDNRTSYAQKAARIAAVWPEVTIVRWPVGSRSTRLDTL